MTDKRRCWRAFLVAAGLLAITSAGHAQTPAQVPKPAQIDRNGVLILIRSSLLALDQANKTGNYTVLRDIGAPAFRATRRRDLAISSPSCATTISISRASP
jgi:hypothetical protein